MKIYYTKDGSIGLYDDEVEDIYHSSGGAYTESFQKFVAPSLISQYAKEKKLLKILDICYGIGYNTKTAICEAFSGSENIFIEIDALEYNKELIILSAFLKDINYPNELKRFLVKSVMENFSKKDIDIVLKNQKYKEYLSRDSIKFYKFLTFWGYEDNLRVKNNRFLHNIYYHYLSYRYYFTLKSKYFKQIKINYHVQDARCSVKQLKDAYDYVFHDGFTPAKQPTLWTLEFFAIVKSLIKEDSMLLTYSNAASIRSALLANGFSLGKTISKNGKSIGTVASLSPKKIATPLTTEELGLLNTKAGIFYRDTNLQSDENEIKLLRENEVAASEKISSGKYLKSLRGKNVET